MPDITAAAASAPISSTNPFPTRPLAVLSALAEEQHGLIDLLTGAQCLRHAGRDFWCGHLHGRPVVLALSRIGKVAAATTAAALIERFGVGAIVFTGVAGGLGDGVNVGDIVVARDFIQHDIDASPLFPRFEVPLYGCTRFPVDAALTDRLAAAAAGLLDQGHDGLMFPQARLHHGLIASGDRFVSGHAESDALRSGLRSAGHDALAVEMEGAAVAQVCIDYGIPFAAVRTISDRADDTAHVDFPSFVKEVASRYARAITERFLRLS